MPTNRKEYTMTSYAKMLSYYGFSSMLEYMERYGVYNLTDAKRMLTAAYEEDTAIDAEAAAQVRANAAGLLTALDHKANDMLMQGDDTDELTALEEDRDAMQIALKRGDLETMYALIEKYN